MNVVLQICEDTEKRGSFPVTVQGKNGDYTFK